MENKNKEILEAFVKYCEEHPEERFWQALRNWTDVDYILFGATSNTKGLESTASLDGLKVYVEDTFYKNGIKD